MAEVPLQAFRFGDIIGGPRKLQATIEAGADIEAVLSEYAIAVLAKEPARVAALYAADVRVFDAWGVWSFEDRAAWARTLDDW